MKILVVAAEISPWAKVGGLADVIGALPLAMARAGAEVSIMVPGYSRMLDSLKTESVAHESVRVGSEVESFELRRASGPGGVPLFIISHPRYFERPGIYGDASGDYPDNLRRYALFGRAAAIIAARHIRPDVIHAHDWHSSIAAIMSRADPDLRAALGGTAVAFTIHNVAFQGMFPAADFQILNLDPSFFSINCLEFWGRMNLLKGAIVLADGVSTVSPSYAAEISHDPELSFGLDGVLRGKGSNFVGITNGADYDEWDPAKDTEIVASYSPSRRAGKRRCKAALRQALGLIDDPAIPVVGMVTRMVTQKGLDLLALALDAVVAQRVHLVILGSGEPELERAFRQGEERHPRNVRVRFAFDNALAHQIQAGSDIFLMPSRFEPCGLTQMYACKYGTAPLVRATGGLRDTINEFNPKNGTGNGFVFTDYQPASLVEALARATRLFHQPAPWKRLMDNCFASDFSWPYAAARYLEWFERLRYQRGV